MQRLARHGQRLLGPGAATAALAAELGPLSRLRLAHSDVPAEPSSTEHHSSGDGGGGGAAQTEVGAAERSGGGVRAREHGHGRKRQGKLHPALLVNGSRYLTRQDIVDFFRDYNLTAEEVRVQYSEGFDFVVEKFWVNFPSRRDRDRAMERRYSYLGARRVVLRPATAEEFKAAVFNPMAMSSRGRYVLVSGLPESSTSEDVHRFFHGYGLHAKSVTFVREHQGERGTLGKAVVRFDSPEEAHRAVRSKQGGFCVGSPVSLRLLV